MKWRKCSTTIPMSWYDVLELIGPMASHGQKKEELWRNRYNGNFPGKMFIKETSYLFQQRCIYGRKF